MGDAVTADRPALAGRKPRLLFRLPGEFLLRLAERQLDAELFQLPPRLTRLDAPACALAPPGVCCGYQTTGGEPATQARRRARVSPRSK